MHNLKKFKRLEAIQIEFDNLLSLVSRTCKGPNNSQTNRSEIVDSNSLTTSSSNTFGTFRCSLSYSRSFLSSVWKNLARSLMMGVKQLSLCCRCIQGNPALKRAMPLIEPNITTTVREKLTNIDISARRDASSILMGRARATDHRRWLGAGSHAACSLWASWHD